MHHPSQTVGDGRSLRSALDAHESRKFGGKVVSIEAAGSQDAADRSRPWWADLTQGGVETYSIDCEHEKMMNVEPVLSIGKIFSDLFARYGPAR
ncbi:hypothetical protein ACNTMW_33080 [Planosporangium sp. 12N6]|uniref:hypothetical protein n=1 Tax=Planosporangium spinosum TaxID=3402278 RepID=UPI003CF9622D